MALLLLLFWQVPAFLKGMPSRYVARLPEPVQALGKRGDGVPREYRWLGWYGHSLLVVAYDDALEQF